MDDEISNKKYWDDIYKSLISYNFVISQNSYWKRKFFSLLKKYLEKDPAKKMVEIGGAPGISAVLFNKVFGYDSYSIDYSEIGTNKTIENFKINNIPLNNAIGIDFLNEEKLAFYNGYFDIVFSDGFIEHFKDPSSIVNLHLKILKNGGYLVIMIPVNNFVLGMQSFFKKGVVNQYDGSFMNIVNFSKVFTSNGELEIKYLNYIGGINLGVICYDNLIVRKFMNAIQLFIQIIGLEYLIPLNKYTSPYLICICTKKY